MICPKGFTDRTSLGFSSLLLFAQRCSEISVGDKCCKHYVVLAGSCRGHGIVSKHVWPHTVAEQRLIGDSEERQ